MVLRIMAVMVMFIIVTGQAYAIPMEKFPEVVKIDSTKILDQRFDQYSDFNIVVADWQGNITQIQMAEHGKDGNFDLVLATRENPAVIAFDESGDRLFNGYDMGSNCDDIIALIITPMGPILNIKATVDGKTYELNATADEYNLGNDGVVSYDEDVLSQARVLVNVRAKSVVVCQHGDAEHYYAIAGVNLGGL